MTEADGRVEERVADWIAAWNQDDEIERLRLLRRCWTENGRLTTPLVDVTGVERIAEHVSDLKELHPGYEVRRTSEIQRQFDQIRFTWQLANADNDVALGAMDVVQIDTQCRFVRLIGFSDTLVPFPRNAVEPDAVEE